MRIDTLLSMTELFDNVDSLTVPVQIYQILSLFLLRGTYYERIV